MIEFRLPSLGADMDEGKLLQWLVRPGDRVQKGQIVCIVDTAKAAIDVECWHDGTVHALLTEPGTTIPVGTLMAVLREPGEAAEAVDAWLAQQAKAKPAPVAAAPIAAPVAAPVTAVAAAAERKRISPAARKRAAELGIDPDRVAPGADGTVSLEDVERAARPAKPAAPIDRATEMRKVIAAAMARSKREIPHYYLAEDVPLAAAMQWLTEQNAKRSVTERLLLAPLLLKAVASALQRYPEFNGYFRDGAFERAGIIPVKRDPLRLQILTRSGRLLSPQFGERGSYIACALQFFCVAVPYQIQLYRRRGHRFSHRRSSLRDAT
ncbi:hypothetical protein FBR04_20690, partial [Betaproteobacteria bacterium PRO7]|nr:hypothetical protein [Betaproteobacteria bacterium PRO7]